MLTIEIHGYGTDTPFTIPLEGLDIAAAQSYVERLRSDLIQAQARRAARISIRPPVHGQGELNLNPNSIKQVDLVDLIEPDEPITENIPVVAASAAPESADSSGPHAALPSDLQRRMEILLG